MTTKASTLAARLAWPLATGLLAAGLASGCDDPSVLATGSGGDGLPSGTPITVDLSEAPVAVARCPRVFAQSGTCLTIDGVSGVVAVGMDDGAVCFVQEIDDVGLSSGDVGDGIAVHGDSVFMCAGDELMEVALTTGAVTPLGHLCTTVSGWKTGGLTLLQGPSPLQVIGVEATTADNATAAPSILIGDVDRGVTRHAVVGDVLYGAWHSTDTIERYDLAAGTWLAPLALEGFDGWVLGIGLLRSGHLAVPPRISEPFYVFDLETGAQVRSFGASADSFSPAGLACDPYPDYVALDLTGD